MLPLHAVAQSAAAGIVSCLVLGMLVAAVVWLLMRLLPSGSAGLRFAVWFSALGAIGLVPVVQNFLQANRGGAGSVAVAQSFLVLPARLGLVLVRRLGNGCVGGIRARDAGSLASVEAAVEERSG